MVLNREGAQEGVEDGGNWSKSNMFWNEAPIGSLPHGGSLNLDLPVECESFPNGTQSSNPDVTALVRVTPEIPADIPQQMQFQQAVENGHETEVSNGMELAEEEAPKQTEASPTPRKKQKKKATEHSPSCLEWLGPLSITDLRGIAARTG